MRPETVILSFFALAAAEPSKASPNAASCTVIPDPEVAGGMNLPAPCWQDFDTACRPTMLRSTTMTINAKDHSVTVTGVSKNCISQIKEELARREDGRKTHGWVEKYGNLQVSNDGVLVITNMTDSAVKAYQQLLN